MSNIILVIVTALISGLLATVVTIWWQHKNAVYNSKMEIFKTLMSYRYDITAEESVKALNSLNVIFYKNANVREAYKDFLDETDKNPDLRPNIADKHLKLLEEISKTLKLKNIHWDEIKHYYYPQSLSEKLQDEKILRKVQIQSSVDVIEQNKQLKNAPDDQFAQRVVLQMLPTLLQNPESIDKLLELGKKYGDKK